MLPQSTLQPVPLKVRTHLLYSLSYMNTARFIVTLGNKKQPGSRQMVTAQSVGDSIPIAARQSRKRKEPSASVQPSVPQQPFQAYDCHQLSSFANLPNMLYLGNIILTDSVSNKAILQVFHPPSKTTEKEMKASIKEGTALLETMDETCSCYRSTTTTTPALRDNGAFNHFHLGIWYDRPNQVLTTTNDQRQTRPVGDKPTAQETVTDFSLWLKSHVESFVQPLVTNNGYQLDKGIQEELSQRKEAFDWLSDRHYLAKDLCHDYYSTYSPFRGFSDRAHKDEDDAGISILLNNGAAAWLELPDYNVRVLLQPLDIVFIDTKTVEHRTLQVLHPLVTAEQRWAVTCFMRYKIVEGHEPKRNEHDKHIPAIIERLRARAKGKGKGKDKGKGKAV